jgi:hypothetical protein
MIGVICLVIGVMAPTFKKANGAASNPKALILARATGVCIAFYNIVDGLGPKQAGSVSGFAVWLTIGDGLPTFFIALAWKRSAIWQDAKQCLYRTGWRIHAGRSLLDNSLDIGSRTHGNSVSIARTQRPIRRAYFNVST